MLGWKLKLWLLIALAVQVHAVYDRSNMGIKTKSYQPDVQYEKSDDEESFQQTHHQQQQQQQYQQHNHYSNSRNYVSPPSSYHSTDSSYGSSVTSSTGRLSAAQSHYGSGGVGAPSTQQQNRGEDYYRQRQMPVYDRGTATHADSSAALLQDDLHTGCPPQHTGPVPYAYDCRRFVNCWHGRGHIQSCGPGTVFNPETLECDRPDKVVCGALNAEGIQSTRGNEAQLSSGNSAKYRAGRLLDVSTDSVETLCARGVTGLQPHPSDCTKFLNCANGNVHVQSCGPGTAFSAKMLACDYKDKVDCSGRQGRVHEEATYTHGSQHKAGIACPAGAAGIYPHPYDCTKFLNCAHGEIAIQSCAPGTAFDRTKLLCDYKDKVNCVATPGYEQQSTPKDGYSETYEETGNIFCPLDVTGLFAYPFDYTRFLNCKKGNTAIQNCMPGTVYSISRGYCDLKDHVPYTDHVAYIVTQVSYDYALTVVSCPPSTDGVHLYPYDCAKYIQCEDGRMTVESCAPNMVFSTARRTCLPKANVNAQDRVQYQRDIQQNSGSLISQSYGKEVLQCPHGYRELAYFPHPFDFNKYLQCTNGQLSVEFCTSGTVFSLSNKRCEPKEHVASNDKVHCIWANDEAWLTTMNFDHTNYDQGTVYLTCPQNVNGYFLYPFDCTKYLSCRNGVTHVENCAGGTVFSISQQKCVGRNQVEAYDRVEYFTETKNEFSTETDQSNRFDRPSTAACPRDATGLYPHPHDCTKFLNCANGVTTIQDCGPGTAWNSKMEVCDFMANVGCTDRSSYTAHESEKPTCPTGLTGLHPHPYDCTKYLSCANGIDYIQDCGPGTGFNAQLLVCDYLEKVHCTVGGVREGKGLGLPDKIECPTYSSGLYPHPFDCTKFLTCDNGVAIVKDCGPGTAWNAKMEVCDFIANVNCADTSVATSHTTLDTSTDYSNRGSKSYSHGGDYDSHTSASRKNDWTYGQSGPNQLYSGYQPYNPVHSDDATTTTTTVYQDRWSNMNRRRPVPAGSSIAHSGSGQGYGVHQQSSTYGGSGSHHNTGASSWTGGGSAVDYQTPTQSVIYEEGSLEPNRNYNSLQTYNTPLAPFSSDSAAAATAINKNNSIHASPIPHVPTRNIYYATPVGSQEDSEENFVNPKIPSGTQSKWTPIPNQNLLPPLPSAEQPQLHNQANAIDSSSAKSLPPQTPATHLMPPLRHHQTHSDDQPGFGAPSLYPNSDETRTNPYEPDTKPAQRRNPTYASPYPSPSASSFEPPSIYMTPPLSSSKTRNHSDASLPTTPEADASNLYGGMLPPLQGIPSTTPLSPSSSPATYARPPTPPTYLEPPTPPTTPLPLTSSTAKSTHLSRIHPSQMYPSIASAFPQNFTRDPHYSPPYANVAHSRDSVWSQPSGGNIQPIKTSHRKVPHSPSNPPTGDNEHEVDELLIGDALRLMLRPYFNRSGTVSEDAAESNIMKLIPQSSEQTPEITAFASPSVEITSTTRKTLMAAETEAEVELILAGEQHSLSTVPIKNGTHETRTEFYTQHTRERTDGNNNLHGHEHSREFHSRHPNLPNSFATTQDSQVNVYVPPHPPQHRHMHHTHHTHSRQYHQRHPELPNPYATVASVGEGGSSINASFYNPHAESTTSYSVYPRLDMRGSIPDCQFDCGNGKCVQSFEVCDGVNNCGNRKDEKQCNHLGYLVRLTGGESSNMGRLEVKTNGKWGYVCDDKFGLPDADVACRELGFALGASEIRGNSYYPPTELDISFAMDEVDCRGNETSLRECDFKGWGVSNCGPDEVVGVVCKVAQFKCPNNYWLCSTSKECIPPAFVCDNTPDCADNSDEADEVCNSPVEYRLAGGHSPYEGRLEVRYRGEWGTVCDDDFGLKEAQVLCNSMSLYGKPIIEKNKYGAGSGPIWLDQVSCFGNETSLDQCHHWTWGEHNCNHAEDVGLKCTSGSPPRILTASDVQSQLEDIDLQQQIEDTQRSLEDIGLYSGQWERNSKALGHQRRCGQFKTNLVDEYAHPEERVVNGTVAKRGHHPWQATIRTKGRGGISSHWCGAVLISSRHLLTAAHCLAGYPKGAYFVRMGDHYANIAESSEIDSFIENWYIHEKFRDQTHMNNDIALVVLKTAVKFNDYIQPVCLPEKGAQLEENRLCTISGWGSIKSGVSTPSNILRAAQLPILSDAVCKQSHVYGASMTEGMFCAGFMDESVDACDGDSGGPLICHDEDVETLQGIISWGQHCGYANKPGVYVRVEKYVDWILDKINISMHNS